MRICVDAGHGGRDPGAVAGGIREADLVLPYALRLEHELRARGHEVVMTRVDDSFPSLSDRSSLANREGVECFVSVHANASGNADAQGWQTFHAAGSVRGRELATLITEAVRPVTGTTRWTGTFPDGSPQTGNRTLHVLRATHMPAVLLELGFLTNARDRALMQREEWRDDVCRAVADAVETWGGVERRPAPDPLGNIPRPEPEIVGWAAPRAPEIRPRVEMARQVAAADTLELAREMGEEPSKLCQAAPWVRKALPLLALVPGAGPWRRVLDAVLVGVEDRCDKAA